MNVRILPLRLILRYIGIVALGLFLLQACGGDGDEPASAREIVTSPTAVAPALEGGVASPIPEKDVPSDRANLEIRATDAPPEGVTKILVTVSSIEVQKAGGDGWQVVVPGPVDFDLVEIQGVEKTLGEALLDPGLYGQVRLVVDKAEVTVEGDTVSARVPSDKLKIVGGFSLEAGQTTILTLDFDAAKSVVIAGKRNVLIKPVIKMLTRKGDRPLQQAEEVGALEEEVDAEPEDTGSEKAEVEAAEETEADEEEDDEEPITVGSKSTITVAEHPELGTILVDGEGFTLYQFLNDEPNLSNCTGGCASTWPPLLASLVLSETIGEGVDADLVGSSNREDGSVQVTYNAHPLYNFSGDRNPGDARGQGIGAVWFAVSPSGEPVSESESESESAAESEYSR